MDAGCIFCRIATKQAPARIVYEDEEFLAFRDLNPQAPIHVLLIPKVHYPTIMDVADAGLLGRATLAVGEIAKQFNIAEEGFRIVVNCRDNGGQTIYHLHLHLLGGRFMTWPPG